MGKAKAKTIFNPIKSNKMKTSEQIKQQMNEARELLNLPDNFQKYLSIIKPLEAELKEAKIRELLADVNGRYNRLREMAREIWECEIPTEDITTADGSFHKTKVKKYPKIAALQYLRANWENDRITVFNYNGERFSMYRVKYEYGKQNEYTRPSSFGDFLELNLIPLREITIQEYKEKEEKLNEANEKLRAALKEYRQTREKLGISKWNYWRLVGQHDLNEYEYTMNS